jgi:hypothetical protein
MKTCQFSTLATQLPPSLARAVMAAAKAKASRHAVTPQLRPKSKVSLPVAPPASHAGRRHRQNK